MTVADPDPRTEDDPVEVVVATIARSAVEIRQGWSVDGVTPIRRTRAAKHRSRLTSGPTSCLQTV